MYISGFLLTEKSIQINCENAKSPFEKLKPIRALVGSHSIIQSN